MRAGGVRQRAEDLAARRSAAPPRRMADHGGAQPRPGPAAPQRGGGGEAEGGGRLGASRRSRPGRRQRDPGRPAAPDVHLLPSGAAAGSEGRAHPAHPGRPDHRGDRAGVPGARAHDGKAPGPGQEQDPPRRDPVPGAPLALVAGTRRRGARRALPAIQRGVCGQRRGRPGTAGPVRGGDPAGPGPGRPDAGRARGARPAGAHAAARRPRAARVDAAGDLVTLEDQDRARWERAEIDEGAGVLDAALRRGRAGPYQLQAAIAACHATAPDAAATDWAEIALLYWQLGELMPSPVVELNRAVAVAMSRGPEAGLELVAAIEDSGVLAGYYLLPATRADLLRRLGRLA